MLTKNEIEKRLARDQELYTRLTNERKTVYQRVRRYRDMLYHMNKIEIDLNQCSVCDD